MTAGSSCGGHQSGCGRLPNGSSTSPRPEHDGSTEIGQAGADPRGGGPSNDVRHEALARLGTRPAAVSGGVAVGRHAQQFRIRPELCGTSMSQCGQRLCHGSGLPKK